MDPEDEYGTIAPIERSPYWGAASDAATGVRQFLNRAQIPYLGGAGDLLVGQAPEELDRWAYGFHPLKDRAVPGYSGLRIPELQERRAGPVADTLFLGADATGLGMGTAALGRAGVRGAARQFQNAVSDAGMDASRRKFVKNAGIVGGTAAVASATPDLVKAGLRGLKTLAPEPTTVGTRVAKNTVGSVPEFYKKLRQLAWARDKAAIKYSDEINASPEVQKRIADIKTKQKAELLENPEVDEPNWAYYDMEDELADYNHEINLLADERAQIDYEEALGQFLEENPDYYDLPDINTIKYTRNEELPTDFWERTGMLPDDNAIADHLRAGGTYTDPVTGNEALLVKGAPPAEPGHVGTRFDIEWKAPDGTVAPYQHWLPEYIPDEEIGTRAASGMRKYQMVSPDSPF